MSNKHFMMSFVLITICLAKTNATLSPIVLTFSFIFELSWHANLIHAMDFNSFHITLFSLLKITIFG